LGCQSEDRQGLAPSLLLLLPDSLGIIHLKSAMVKKGRADCLNSNKKGPADAKC
jgi:hypothetical protein